MIFIGPGLTKSLRTPLATLLGLAPSTLERYRSVGGGPVFCRLTERLVRYRREDLAAWEAEHRPS